MIINIVSSRPWHKEPAKAVQEGFKKHGISVPITNRPVKADLNVCWGMNIASQVSGDYLLMERAYLGDRYNWISLGYNGLNGDGDYCNKNSPSDRWDKYWSMKDWNVSGDHILITTQIPGDNSIKDIDVNYQRIINSLKFLDMPIKVRPHPLRPGIEHLSGADLADSKIPVEKAVQDAFAVVTINSNSGVDAIMQGTPVLNYSNRSMAWEVAMKDVKELLEPPTPDRTQWGYDIAYAQWLPEEIASGEAWEHLRKKYA